jgi:hypothetical protein
MGWFVSGNKTSTDVLEFPVIQVKDRLKKIEISGYSRMTNPSEYYDQMIQLLENYYAQFKKTLIIDFRFEYINTASTKWIYQMLVTLQQTVRSEGIVEINWYYEEDDETIQETGEVFRSTLKLPFHLKVIPII